MDSEQQVAGLQEPFAGEPLAAGLQGAEHLVFAHPSAELPFAEIESWPDLAEGVLFAEEVLWAPVERSLSAQIKPNCSQSFLKYEW